MIDPPHRAAIARGNQHSAAGRLDAAVAAYREALAQQPGDLEALTNLGATLTQLGQGDAAVAAYRVAIEANPAAVEPQLNLAIALTRAGRARDALAVYHALLKAHPDHVAAQFYCANLLASLNALEAARAGYDRVLTLDRDHAEAYCNRGIIAAACHESLAAEEDFYTALSRNPRLAGAWQQLGRLFVGAQRHADAAVAFARLSALQPDDPVPHCQRAQALAATGDSDAAIAAFAQAIGLSAAPYPEALRGLASLELGRGDHDAAQRHYADAAAAEPVIPWHGAAAGRARVLALIAPGLGNTPAEHLVAASTHGFSIVLVLPGTDYDTAALAARGDLVLNLVSDADVSQGVLPHAARLADRIGRPTINHPAKIGGTERQAVAQRLAELAGCRVPETLRLPRAALDQPFAAAPDQPWLIRPVGDHGGERLARVTASDEIASFVATTDNDAFYLTRFVDYRSADGHYRKYRIIFLGDAILPYHLAIGDHWKVHYFRTPMDQHDWMRREEEAFVADHRQAFDAAQCATLAAIRDTIDLEFFGIDCGLDRDGALVLFEANASMLIHANDSRTLFPYKQASFERIRDAFDRLIESRAATR